MLNQKDYAGSVAFLVSDHYVMLGCVIDSSTVTADSDGDKILKAGTILGKITASGKFGPYDSTATDGRQTAVGILAHDVDVTKEDAMVNYLIHGVVQESKLTGIDATAKTQLSHIIFI
ncbi:head decoration protein [Marinitoga sp. 1155]|uniref:head decoration protein n=1 Tax=Marinitoga sp. 1155 TaxID=1428448 RepID=UPI00064187CC|nr:head decoration protein [Marinitoga sp. 1155]AJW76992.1 hypothetical protein UF09_26 [Marinitoga camini virus 2]KLO24746.1 K structural protein [Marinitoga sp. 1155]